MTMPNPSSFPEITSIEAELISLMKSKEFVESKLVANLYRAIGNGVSSSRDFASLRAAHHLLSNWMRASDGITIFAVQTALLGNWPWTRGVSYSIPAPLLERHRSPARAIADHVRRIQHVSKRYGSFDPAVWIAVVPTTEKSFTWRVRGAVGLNRPWGTREHELAEFVEWFVHPDSFNVEEFNLDTYEFDMQNGWNLMTGPYAWGLEAVRLLGWAREELGERARNPLYISQNLIGSARREYTRAFCPAIESSGIERTRCRGS